MFHFELQLSIFSITSAKSRPAVEGEKDYSVVYVFLKWRRGKITRIQILSTFKREREIGKHVFHSCRSVMAENLNYLNPAADFQCSQAMFHQNLQALSSSSMSPIRSADFQRSQNEASPGMNRTTPSSSQTLVRSKGHDKPLKWLDSQLNRIYQVARCAKAPSCAHDTLPRQE